MSDIFSAVYYSGPTPSSMRKLTLLAMIFDRVYFPGVYIPQSGLDKKETIEELKRLKALEHGNLDDIQTINCITLALNIEHVKEFFVFTGVEGTFGKLEPETSKFTKVYEEMIYGPPPKGFFPTYTMGFNKGLPGGQVNGPSWLSYPPNAMFFAAREGMVLVNDNPGLPIPTMGSSSLKSNANILASVMALESLKLILPNIRSLGFEELSEFREETKEIAKQFRLSMLRLSQDLNQAILSNATLEDVIKEAKFLADTVVLPELEDFRRIISEPSRKLHRRIVDTTKLLPELVANFATMPKGLATAKVLASLAGIFADVRDEQLEKEGKVKRGIYHYLLKVGELSPKE